MRGLILPLRSTICATLLAVTLTSAAAAADGFMVRVKTDPGHIKSGNEVLANVPKGTRLWVFEVKARQWANVKVPDGEQKGWIHRAEVEDILLSEADQKRQLDSYDLYLRAEKLEAAHDLAAAIELMRQSVAIDRDILGDDHPDVADAWGTLANLLSDIGQAAEAAEICRRTLKIRREMLGETHPLTHAAMNNLANSLTDLGDYQAARDLHQRSLELKRQVQGAKHPDTLISMNNLASLLWNLGEFTEARTLYEQTIALRREVLGPKHAYTLASMNNLAGVLDNLGDHAAAHTLHEEVLAARRETLGENHPRTLRSMNNLALVLAHLGDLNASRQLHEQTLAARRQLLGEKHQDTLASMNNLAGILRMQGHKAEARQLLEQTIKLKRHLLSETQPDLLDSIDSLAVVLNELGDHAEARKLQDESLTMRRNLQGELHPDTLRLLRNLVLTMVKQGNLAEAMRTADEHRRLMRQVVTTILPALSDEEQLKYLQAQDEVTFQMLLSLGLISQQQPEFAALSANWLLNGKAVAQESLSERTRLARQATDPVVSERLQQLTSLRSRLSRHALKTVAPGKEEAHRQQLTELEKQEAALSRELGQLGQDVERKERWVEIEGVRQTLPDSSVLIEIARTRSADFSAFKRGPAHYVAWLIPPAGQGDVRIVDLGEASMIDQTIQASRNALNEGQEMLSRLGADAAEERVNKPLRALAEQVLDPLIAEVGDAKKLILSPDAALWLVPWAALPLKDGRYAIEEYQFSYVVSGRDLMAKSSPAPTDAAPVIMADPNFDLTPTLENTPVARGGRSASRFVGSFNDLTNVGRLPGTAKEARAITPFVQQYLDAAPTIHLQDAAREEVFKQLKQPSLLVLSTHGYFLEDQQQVEPADGLTTDDRRKVAATSNGQLVENPLLRCGLLLAGCNNRGQASDAVDDGVLTGMEIVGTNLRGTKLVVLSACETGIGEVQNGEGVAGLRQAFQLAGAESVLATLWQVPDEQTAMLMEYFFENLAAGQGKSEALRNAQLSLMSLIGRHNNTTHPYYWAAFTLTGSYE